MIFSWKYFLEKGKLKPMRKKCRCGKPGDGKQDGMGGQGKPGTMGKPNGQGNPGSQIGPVNHTKLNATEKPEQAESKPVNLAKPTNKTESQAKGT